MTIKKQSITGCVTVNYLGGAAVELQGSLERVAWVTVWVTERMPEDKGQTAGGELEWQQLEKKTGQVTEMALCHKSHRRASDM